MHKNSRRQYTFPKVLFDLSVPGLQFKGKDFQDAILTL